MKHKISRFPVLSLAIAAMLAFLNAQPSSALAQGTAFVYQGRINDGGSPATGIYDLRFAVCDALTSGNVVAGPLTNSATGVTNGLFAVTLDFGGGVFTGSNRWVEIAARTNGAAAFTALAPRQPVQPVPYAIMANTASNLLGALPGAQLTGTISASQLSGTFTGNVIGSASTATNFSGALAGDVSGTQGATVVSSVGGQSAANVASGASAANAATSAATANTLVKRDVTGSFSATNLTLSSGLNLPAVAAIYSGGSLLLRADANANFFAGPGAGNLTASGYNNTGVGVSALTASTSGLGNTAVGSMALNANTSGANNTASGLMALASNTNGYGNVASGYNALAGNINGYDNTACGVSTLAHNNGNFNTAIGAVTMLWNATGGSNTANGAYALTANISGSCNTANGFQAMNQFTNGLNNVASGFQAMGYSVSGTNNVAVGAGALIYANGTNNIALGYFAGMQVGNNNIDVGNAGSTLENNTIRIGSSQSQTYIAGISGVTISPSGAPVYVNANGQLGTVNSSRRFKEAIQDMTGLSDVIFSLRPVAFHYLPELDPLRTPQYGLIAEEVEQVAPELVLRDAKGSVLSVRYEQINAMLLNEFLKEHKTVEAQTTEIQSQSAEIQDLKARLNKLEQLFKTRSGGE
jgi:Chaperone of endosialidase